MASRLPRGSSPESEAVTAAFLLLIRASFDQSWMKMMKMKMMKMKMKVKSKSATKYGLCMRSMTRDTGRGPCPEHREK
jgi:hypothetical protein